MGEITTQIENWTIVDENEDKFCIVLIAILSNCPQNTEEKQKVKLIINNLVVVIPPILVVSFIDMFYQPPSAKVAILVLM